MSETEFRDGLEEPLPLKEVLDNLRDKEELRLTIAKNRVAFLDKLIFRFENGELDEMDVTEILEKVYISDGES